MAEDPADDKGGNPVKVTTSELRTSADSFEKWGDDLILSLDGLAGYKLLSGDFPEADKLETTVNDRVIQLTTNVTNIGNSLKDIGSKLRIVADDYDATEDDNVGDAERIDPMFDSVNTDLNQPPDETP
jgi:hypothetical protein